MHLALVGCAWTSGIVVLLIFAFLANEGLPVLADIALADLAGERWNPVSMKQPRFGLVPLLAGSGLITAIAIVLAIPFGVGGAIYTAEFAMPAEREVLKPVIELLAGIPSVVLGFFGLVTVAPLVKSAFGLPSGLTALTGAIVLALMATPTVLSIAEDALRAVPRSYREASLALGASGWQTVWRVTVPAAASGIAAAIMLGVGRIIGETMAVMMVCGNAPLVTLSPFEPVRTMTATIAAEMGEVPAGTTHYHALFMVGLVLLVITLAVNLAARAVLSRGAGGGRR